MYINLIYIRNGEGKEFFKDELNGNEVDVGQGNTFCVKSITINY